MITQSLFHTLQKSLAPLVGAIIRPVNEAKQFTYPHALIIHQPTGRGFYLDRDYRHIIDVENCQEPVDYIEVERNYLCAGSDLPAWAQTENPNEFDTFWLY